MNKPRALHILGMLLFSSFAVFALGFNHVSLNRGSMNGMEGMRNHSRISSMQCQTVCTTATKSDELLGIFNQHENDIEPLPAIGSLFTFGLVGLALAFVVKRLHLLSSWRPPDLVLVCGHYADGL